MDRDSDKGLHRSYSFIDLVLILLKWKKIIISGVVLVAIISTILFFFVFEVQYMSTTTIKSSGKSPSFLMGIDGLGDLGGISDIVGGSSSSKELAYYMEVINSRRSLEALIKEFSLLERYDVELMEDAVKILRYQNLSVDFDKVSGLMTIGAYDKDPVFAKQMVEFLIEMLNKINIELSVLNAKNNREFIEKRYLQSKEDLSNAEDTLKAFQQIYGVAPDLQIKASAQSVFTMEAELQAEEVKLDVLKKILSSDQPEVRTQEAKVNSLKSKIQEIRNSTNIDELLSLGNSPNIALNYIRLQREIEIQSKIMSFVLPLYEQSKIEEKRETPTILILDPPNIAEKKTRPKRLRMIFIAIFITTFIISAIILVYEVYVKNFLLAIKGK